MYLEKLLLLTKMLIFNHNSKFMKIMIKFKWLLNAFHVMKRILKLRCIKLVIKGI